FFCGGRTLRCGGGIAVGNLESDGAHFFVDEAVGCENDGTTEPVRLILEITDSSTGFLDEEDARSGVPSLKTKFPKTIEAAGRYASEIECGGAITADAVGSQREIVVVVNIGAGLALVNGKARAEKTG